MVSFNHELPLTIGVDGLAAILLKAPSTVLRLLRDEPDSLPPPIPSRRLGDRPVWLMVTVLEFLGWDFGKVPMQVLFLVASSTSAPPLPRGLGADLNRVADLIAARAD